MQHHDTSHDSVRTALVTTSWPRFDADPAGHFVRADARGREARGERVTVLAAEGDAFGWPGLAARLAANPLRAVGAARWVIRARQQVTAGRFDQVVAHWAVPCAWPISLAGDHALHVVSHGGDVRVLLRLPAPIRTRLVRTLATRATSWQFVAAHLRDALASSVPADVRLRLDAVAFVEPCALEVPRPGAGEIAALRAQIGEPFVVCLARLVESKRVDAAIRHASQRGIPLVVVGDGPQRGALEDLARRTGARVSFMGKVPRGEALAWMAASTAMLQASRVEGASTVEREAAALGVEVRLI